MERKEYYKGIWSEIKFEGRNRDQSFALSVQSRSNRPAGKTMREHFRFQLLLAYILWARIRSHSILEHNIFHGINLQMLV
jgi:xylose isomerase